MKCITCGVEIPGPNGKHFYESINFDGMQCELCAVTEYKKANPFWNIAILKNPLSVPTSWRQLLMGNESITGHIVRTNDGMDLIILNDVCYDKWLELGGEPQYEETVIHVNPSTITAKFVGEAENWSEKDGD